MDKMCETSVPYVYWLLVYTQGIAKEVATISLRQVIFFGSLINLDDLDRNKLKLTSAIVEYCKVVVGNKKILMY